MNDELHKLIKSLTQGEKKHFTFFALSKGDDSKQFYHLFTELDKQSKYDEKKLLLKLDKKQNLQQFRVLKNYLHEEILSSLEYYNQNLNADFQIRSLLNRCEILYNKGLYEQCFTLLEKAEKLVEKNEKSEYMYIIMRMQSNVVMLAGSQFGKEFFPETFLTKSEELSKKTELLFRSRYYYTIFYKEVINAGISRDKTESDRFEKLFKSLTKYYDDNKVNKIPFDALCDIYSTFGLYYWKKTDWKKFTHYFELIVNAFEDNPSHLANKSNYYVSSLSNLALGLAYSQGDAKFRTVAKKLKDYSYTYRKKIGENAFIRSITTANTLESGVLTDKAEYEQAAVLAKEAEEILEIFDAKIPPVTQQNMAFKNSVVYFALGDYHKSLFWCNKLYNEKWVENLRSDFHVYSRFLRLLNHFELGNFEHIDSSVKSLSRYLNNQNKLFGVEKSMLHFIDKVIPKIVDEKLDLKTAFKEFKNELLELSNNEFEKRALGYFDIISWLDSKIENKNFIEVAKRNIELRKKTKH